MAQLTDKEKKQFKKELQDVLDAIENLKKKEGCRLSDFRLICANKAKAAIKELETDFDNSMV